MARLAIDKPEQLADIGKDQDKMMDLIAELKTGTFTNKDGQQSPITDDDILVIAPYNMQVNLLKEKLGSTLKSAPSTSFKAKKRQWLLSQWRSATLKNPPEA
jgi:hypothetical protein